MWEKSSFLWGKSSADSSSFGSAAYPTPHCSLLWTFRNCRERNTLESRDTKAAGTEHESAYTATKLLLTVLVFSVNPNVMRLGLKETNKGLVLGKLLVLGLVVAWVAVLGPSLFRRSDDRSPTSLDAARDRLASLHHGRRGSVVARSSVPPNRSVRPGSSPFAVARASRSAHRRRQVVAVLVFGMVGSLSIAFATRNLAAFGLHLAIDGMFLLFVMTVRGARSGSSQRGRGVPARSAQNFGMYDERDFVVAPPTLRESPLNRRTSFNQEPYEPYDGSQHAFANQLHDFERLELQSTVPRLRAANE